MSPSGPPIDDVDFTRNVSERVHADARGDPSLEAIDEDADVLYNEYELGHARVERRLRDKYDAPRPPEQDNFRATVEAADRLAVRARTHTLSRVRHRVIVGSVSDSDGGAFAVTTLEEPTIYSWFEADPSEVSILTESHPDYAAIPPLVEVAELDTFEVFVSEGYNLEPHRNYGHKDHWGPVVDVVADPDAGDLEALAGDASLGGDQ